MRVVINNHEGITLVGDSDADKALLGMWAEQRCFLASSQYRDSETIKISMTFSDFPIVDKKEKTNDNRPTKQRT